MVVVGTVEVVLDIFLPAPNDFDRAVNLLCDAHRLLDDIGLNTAAEAAPEELVVYLHRLLRQASDLRRGRLHPRCGLGTQPELASIPMERHGAVHGLHRRMSKQGVLIHGVHARRGRGQRHRHVAFLRGDDTFAFGSRRELRSQCLRGILALRTCVPTNVQQRKPLAGRPCMLADNCDHVIEHDNLRDSPHRLGLAVINLDDSTALDR